MHECLQILEIKSIFDRGPESVFSLKVARKQTESRLRFEILVGAKSVVNKLLITWLGDFMESLKI